MAAQGIVVAILRVFLIQCEQLTLRFDHGSLLGVELFFGFQVVSKGETSFHFESSMIILTELCRLRKVVLSVVPKNIINPALKYVRYRG